MRGLIVLDGPDGAGKTTLGKALVAKYGGKYLHLTYRWKNSMFEYHTAALLHAISSCDKQLVVIDRLWMSELIYALVYRGGSTWPHMGRLMDRVVRKHVGMYVLCFDESMKTHQDRFMRLKAERVEMYNDTSDVWALYNSLYHGGLGSEFGQDYFADLASDKGMKVRGDVWKYSIDQEGRNVDQFMHQLMTCLELRQSEQTALGLDSTFQNFLGYAPEAKWVFVGDANIDKQYRKTSWPFYTYEGSSKFLLEQLSKMGFDETTACWTNANGPLGAAVVDLLCDEYGLTPIFMGVGGLSKFKTTELFHGKQFGCIREPEYYTRWRHNSNQLVDDLKYEMETRCR
jgi:thymidylate kinase